MLYLHIERSCFLFIVPLLGLECVLLVHVTCEWHRRPPGLAGRLPRLAFILAWLPLTLRLESCRLNKPLGCFCPER